jgi:hypothetical protein
MQHEREHERTAMKGQLKPDCDKGHHGREPRAGQSRHNDIATMLRQKKTERK